MIKKYDDDFFEDLDKTTDLLKAFKPHIENESSVSYFDDIYSELKIDNKVESKKINNKNNNTFQSFSNNVVKKKEPIIEKSVSINKTSDEKKHDLNAIFDEKYKLAGIIKQKSNNEEIKQTLKQDKKSNVSQIIDDIRKKTDIKKKKDNKKIEDKKEKNNKVKTKTKFSKFEIIFCSFSFLFIVGCLCVYSSRFLKYYRIYDINF